MGAQNDSPVKIDVHLPPIPVWRHLAGGYVLGGFATFCWPANSSVFTFINNPVFQSNEYTFPRDLIFAVFPPRPLRTLSSLSSAKCELCNEIIAYVRGLYSFRTFTHSCGKLRSMFSFAFLSSPLPLYPCNKTCVPRPILGRDASKR